MRKEIHFQTPEIPRRNPGILTHPNIPKPLHGVAPRVVLGEPWWKAERDKAQNHAKGHCQACGTSAQTGRLEAHEIYSIDYQTGVAKYLETTMICHKCHNFIHSGRLRMIAGKEKSVLAVKEILTHGFSVLAKTGLKAFGSTCELAKIHQVSLQGVQAAEIPESDISWADWRMEVAGAQFPPLFPTYESWAKHFESR